MWDLSSVRLGMECGVGNKELAVSPSVLKLPTPRDHRWKATSEEKKKMGGALESGHFRSTEGLRIVSAGQPEIGDAASQSCQS